MEPTTFFLSDFTRLKIVLGTFGAWANTWATTPLRPPNNLTIYHRTFNLVVIIPHRTEVKLSRTVSVVTVNRTYIELDKLLTLLIFRHLGIWADGGRYRVHLRCALI